MNEILFRIEGLLGLGFVWAMYLPRLIALIVHDALREHRRAHP